MDTDWDFLGLGDQGDTNKTRICRERTQRAQRFNYGLTTAIADLVVKGKVKVNVCI